MSAAKSNTIRCLVRAGISLPIVMLALPVAAWADSRQCDRPDAYPARERVMMYVSDWWHWVLTGKTVLHLSVLTPRSATSFIDRPEGHPPC